MNELIMMQTLKQTIEGVLIAEIKAIQQTHGHHYLSFGLIAQGIEFLGACLDSNAFHQSGLSQDRFRRAISHLFPDVYNKFNAKEAPFDLYAHLRCGLLHVLIPGSPIELIQENEKPIFGAAHLEIVHIRGTERLVLVSQDLFRDYEEACRKVIQKIDNGEIDQTKANFPLIANHP